MKIIAISGSHRSNSQSGKVARYVEHRIPSLSPSTCSSVIDLAITALPFWDEGIWHNDPEWEAKLQPLSEQLAQADGFVIVTPEWHGMVPAALKNFFLMWSKQELAHKPALIVSVSAGTGGAYPIAELRTSSYKNNNLCYLPNHVIIRHVTSVLNEDIDTNNAEEDSKIRERVDHALQTLLVYSQAFQNIRETQIVDLQRYPFGM